MNLENKKLLISIQKKIYQVYLNSFSGKKFVDDNWKYVRSLQEMIGLVTSVDDVVLSNAHYENYLDFDNDKCPIREYQMDIETKYGKIRGYIRCFAAGTIDNPFSSYDLIIHLYPIEKSDVNESFIDNYKQYINKDKIKEEYDKIKDKFKSITSFDELSNTAKEYIRKGIALGTIFTIMYTCFNLEENKRKYLELKLIELQFTIELQNEIIRRIPDWKEIINDAEVTVYNAVPKQCNKDVTHTSSLFALNLTNPQSHRVVAVEREMLKKYNLEYGDLIKLEGTEGFDGVYLIQDLMNKRFKGKNKIDILVNNDIKSGKWNNVKVYKLLNPDLCKDEFKKSMAPAKNQKFIDKRQSK